MGYVWLMEKKKKKIRNFGVYIYIYIFCLLKSGSRRIENVSQGLSFIVKGNSFFS